MDGFGLFSDMCTLRNYTSKRSSSWDRTGRNDDFAVIRPGETETLLCEERSGCVKHIYWTYICGNHRPELNAIRWNIFRGCVLRAYWDGEEIPAIEAPLGDFFGISNGMVRPIKSLSFVTNPGGGAIRDNSWGFNCYLPMPYSRGARIEIENQGEHDAQIWYHVDYERYDDPAAVSPDTCRLHAAFNRVNPTPPVGQPDGAFQGTNLSGDDNYVIADIEADGQLAGYFMTVVNKDPVWWGEGDDMLFIDGESFPPSLHGTGTEEIFGGGACPTGEYTGPYTGFHCIESRAGYAFWGTTGMYRFFVTDPIRFRKSLRATIEHGHNNDMANDYSSVAFWYQKGVNRRREKLTPLAGRGIHFI